MNEEILKTDLPLVLFHSHDIENLPENRNPENLIKHTYVQEDISRDFAFFNEYKEAWEKKMPVDDASSKLLFYGPLVLLKFNKVIEVIKANPFNSEYFFWIDASFCRGVNDLSIFKQTKDKSISFCDRIVSKVSNKIIIPTPEFGSRPFGYFWGGRKKSLTEILERYQNTTLKLLKNQLPTEELVFREIIEESSELFELPKLKGETYKSDLVKYFYQN